MIIKEIQKDYKNFYAFITIYHSLIEVKVFDYEDDDYVYKNKFVDYSLDEVWQTIKNGCSARLEQKKLEVAQWYKPKL